MADLTIIPDDVRPGADAILNQEDCGENGVEIGDSLYKRNSDGKVLKSDANTGDPVKAAFYGYAVSNADLNQPIIVQTGGTIFLGAYGMADEGELYIVSSNAGATAVVADKTTGWITSVIGYGDELGNIVISKINTGKTSP
jgi:hypothetical protein